MTELEKFNDTVNILTKSFFNSTLRKGKCAACAVGNIIAHKMGYNIDIDYYNITSWKDKNNEKHIVVPYWQLVFSTSGNIQTVDPNPVLLAALPGKQILSTGYDWEDLAKIEYTFETSYKGKTEEECMFNALMAIVDVLADIHKIDLTVTKEAKDKFIVA